MPRNWKNSEHRPEVVQQIIDCKRDGLRNCDIVRLLKEKFDLHMSGATVSTILQRKAPELVNKRGLYRFTQHNTLAQKYVDAPSAAHLTYVWRPGMGKVCPPPNVMPSISKAKLMAGR